MKKVSPKDFGDRIGSKQPTLHVLDVRPVWDYEGWHIEGANIKSQQLTGADVLKNPDMLGALDRTQPWTVVCALGQTAQEVGKVMERSGMGVSYLEGGMASWSKHHQIVEIVRTRRLSLYQVRRPGKGSLSYVLVSDKQAMVFDPSMHVSVYRNLIGEQDAELIAIADTHIHADYITGGFDLSLQTGVPFYRGASPSDIAGKVTPLHDGQKFQVGQVTVTAIHTPGHTPESYTFFVDNRYLLTGDTIFVSGVGRPDLGGHAHEWGGQLHESVHNLSKLPDDTMVFPAHYAHWTEVGEDNLVGKSLGDIRQANPLLHAGRDEFVHHVLTAAATDTPPNYQTIVALNAGQNKDLDPEAMSALEMGPNHCAAPPSVTGA